MMRLHLGRTLAVALTGLDGHLVEVETLVQPGLPGFVLVGLPDAALGEARDRVRAAFAASGFEFPQVRVTVNLSPASLPKAGSSFDLAIAVSMLAAQGMIAPDRNRDVAYIGELALDGRTRAVRGVLPAVLAAKRGGLERVVVASANAAEAQLVDGVKVVAVDSLAQLAYVLGAPVDPPQDQAQDAAQAGIPQVERPALVRETASAANPFAQAAATPPPDLADVLGQEDARLALELAAAGGHHLMLEGPPGTGKTMLAARLASILPNLDESQAVEVTAIHSVAGIFRAENGLITVPPFQDPHHTATPAAIVGGGSGLPRPGAVSLAHHGVLFLDEAPEFSTRVLQTLREPLERGEVVIHRSAGTARFPARFHLVLACNPCPCGRGWGTGEGCTCTSLAKRRYLDRLSGPLLDRLDMVVGVAPISAAAMVNGGAGESSATVAARVAAARQAQARRYRSQDWSLNAHVPGRYLHNMPGSRLIARQVLSRALEQGLLTARGFDRVLRLAWTVADLAGRDAPEVADAELALALRIRELR
jgi:magnesium chelatase family protein